MDVSLSNSNLEMSWRITKLEDKQILIKLDFDDYNAQTISTSQVKINVTIRFLKTTVYQSSNSTRRILNDSLVEELHANTLVVQEAEYVVT